MWIQYRHFLGMPTVCSRKGTFSYKLPKVKKFCFSMNHSFNHKCLTLKCPQLLYNQTVFIMFYLLIAVFFSCNNRKINKALNKQENRFSDKSPDLLLQNNLGKFLLCLVKSIFSIPTVWALWFKLN